MHPYSIVIPTRNRAELLNKLLAEVNFDEPDLVEVIVVDSSNFATQPLVNEPKIKYIHTAIKSAATQRNIGINNLKKIVQHVFFVDDDVILPKNYFKQLNKCLSENETVGVSGIAKNYNENSVRTKPRGFSGLYRRIFLLDSKRDGALLSSAINIPVRCKNNSTGPVVDAEWIIGCSAWKSSVFDELRFEDKFKGQSLGEDVLFSNKAKKKGKLKVDTTVIMNHLESEIERPNLQNFYLMWVSNRYEISNQLDLSYFNASFHWANLGKSIITLIRWDIARENRRSIIKGIFAGYREVYFGIK